MDEPSVLDYLKAKLTFWRETSLHIPEVDSEVKTIRTNAQQAASDAGRDTDLKTGLAEARSVTTPLHLVLPWRTLVMIFLALFAQRALEPPNRSWMLGLGLYLFAAIFMVWAYIKTEVRPPDLEPDERRFTDFSVRRYDVLIGIPLALLAFALFGGNRFSLLNVGLWLLSLAFLIRAFWISSPRSKNWLQKARTFFLDPHLTLKITPLWLVVGAAIAFVIFFRFYHLNQVPPEMVSDHAEKLLDVYDVLNGKTSIYFPRNTGREFFQFYLTAAIILLFNTGVTFLSLKLGTALAGLFTLPYIYLLGKEVGNRWAGFWAMFFAGIAYWPNVYSRLGLRFPLYPLFAAPTLYYLIRGLRTSNRNDFILAGLALGLGLHGYTSFRIVPFLVIIAVALYLIHRQSQGARKQALYGLGVLVAISFVIFLPLFRFALENPELFAYRAFTRLSDWEQPLPGPAWQIFLQNLWNAVTMFFWSDGGIWVHSVTYRPALDVVSGALLFLGIALLIVRYARNRNWVDIFLIISIPMLMMPSILSLAFPGENPSLNRTSGAIIPVFVIIGIAMDSIVRGLKSRLTQRAGNGLAGVVVLILVAWASFQNYDLVFNQYQKVYLRSSWNTSEIGQIIRSFSESIGSADDVWVVGYPYWVDTRLVGINAGYPTKDYAIWPEQFQDTLTNPRTKLFILNPQDSEGLRKLKEVYPQGVSWVYKSKVETKDLIMFLVPAVQEAIAP
jgi:4-amino-4-deoxy-L-arabinose transferase-like glycosyltransferase